MALPDRAAFRLSDPNQPIIMLTAYADMVTNMTLVSQVDLVIGKPWPIDELRAAIR
jgi:DNA-binding response OmpR family regulator